MFLNFPCMRKKIFEFLSEVRGPEYEKPHPEYTLVKIISLLIMTEA
jgi:hypothetical protein